MSLRNTSPPSASRIISSAQSIVKLPLGTDIVELLLIENLKVSVPLALKIISAPDGSAASRIISPATSIVRSPDDRSISVPSIVMLSIVKP